MGCIESIPSSEKSIFLLTEQTTFDDFEDEQLSFNPAQFKSAIQCSIATGAKVSLRNVIIISLVRRQNENAILVDYIINKDTTIPSLLTLISCLSTHISSGAMTATLQNNGFPNVSVNAPHCSITFADISGKSLKPILKVTQVLNNRRFQ